MFRDRADNVTTTAAATTCNHCHDLVRASTALTTLLPVRWGLGKARQKSSRGGSATARMAMEVPNCFFPHAPLSVCLAATVLGNRFFASHHKRSLLPTCNNSHQCRNRASNGVAAMGAHCSSCYFFFNFFAMLHGFSLIFSMNCCSAMRCDIIKPKAGETAVCAM